MDVGTPISNCRANPRPPNCITGEAFWYVEPGASHADTSDPRQSIGRYFDRTNAVNFDPRQRTVVAIYREPRLGPGNFLCSGVMINDVTVLTAAHCVFGPLGAQPERVCSFGNTVPRGGAAQCADVSMVRRDPLWDGEAPIDRDIALIELAMPLGDPTTGVGNMHVSDARPREVVEAAGHVKNSGYTGFGPDACGTGEMDANGVTDPDLIRVGLTQQPSPAYRVDQTIIRTFAAAASGMSGGPFWFCPGPNHCDPTDTGAVVGVMHGKVQRGEEITDGQFLQSDEWVGGVFVPGRRTWILDHTF